MLYFLDANRYDIFKINLLDNESLEEIVYSHDTYVRGLLFDDDGYLYFSEATGAGDDGRIWRIDEDGIATLYYTVQISTIGGYWAGDFDFEPDGRLFVSSGNHIPSQIYAIDMEDDAVEVILDNPDGSTRGLTFDEYGLLFYVDNKTSIYRLDLEYNKSTKVYETTDYEMQDILWLDTELW
jgi:sugar lactone lactonase YvrE